MKKILSNIGPILGFIPPIALLCYIVLLFNNPTETEKHEKRLKEAVTFEDHVNQNIQYFEKKLKNRIKYFYENKEVRNMVKKIEQHKNSIAHFQKLLKSAIRNKNKKGIEYLKSVISSLEDEISQLKHNLKKQKELNTWAWKEKITYYKSLLKEEKPKKTEEE